MSLLRTFIGAKREGQAHEETGTAGDHETGEGGSLGQKSQNSVPDCVMVRLVALTSSLSVTASTYRLRSPTPAL